MVSLLSLSNELLVQIFSSSDTIQSAATLSEVNKTMNSLWVAHNNQILTNVLPTQIIGYKDAKDTAILEEIWTRKNTELASKTSGQPRVRAYLSTLLHNAKLATQAKKACMLWLHEQNELYDPLYSNLAKYHIAYYRMRKIVLLLEHPESQLQHVIDSAINCTPANTTFTISDAYTSFTLADLNMFLVTDERRYKAAQRNYTLEQRTSSADDANNPHEQTAAKAEKKQKPLRHDYALVDGIPFASHYSYVIKAVLARLREIMKFRQEQRDAQQKMLDGADKASV
jgi:hypothetical protein